MKTRWEEGAALLTVLLLVAVLAALAVGVLEDMRFAVRRTSNAQSVGQAQWYALGAETLARQGVEDRALGVWRTFPIDGGGTIRVRLDDGGACFNLNSLVVGAPGAWLRSEPGLLRYRTLLMELGFGGGEAERLSEGVADWMDTDNGRKASGAEDDAYAAYRTSGELLSEPSELRAIRGYDAATYARVRPYVCALPRGGEDTTLNINTVPVEKAAVLSAVTAGAISLDKARAALADRPPNGWPSLAAFLAREEISDAGAGSGLGTTTNYYALKAEVSWNGGEAVMTSLLGRDGAVLARRWTVDE